MQQISGVNTAKNTVFQWKANGFQAAEPSAFEILSIKKKKVWIPERVEYSLL